MKTSLRIRRATHEDCRLYWEWANDGAVRAASFSSEPIPWDAHVAWFEQRVDAPECRMYVACATSGEPVAQVRFESAGDEAVVSVSVAAQHRGEGIGLAALTQATDEYFSETEARPVAALIRPSNAASLRLFARAGFEDAGEAVVKGQPAVRMILACRERKDG